jgi:hypothetical protein
MKAIIHKSCVCFAVLFLAGGVFAFNASAQCGTGSGDGHSTMNNANSLLSRSVPLRASLKTDASVSQNDQGENDVSIVGFWHVVFTSQGTTNPPIPDGAVVDAGFSQWHSDHTEILNSSRPPATANFCLGVWAKTGRNTYSLNHFALSFNPDGSMQGPANIRETVSLSTDGDSYSGTFSIDQYDTHLNLLAHIVGTISATRVTINTKPTDIF